MEQTRPAQTDQQAMNDALSRLAAAGNTLALNQLWEINRRLIGQLLRRWYDQNRPTADAAGLTFEDLEQEGYFAVKYAVEHYDPEKGCFTTYLSYSVQKQIRSATCGEHCRNSVLDDGRTVVVSANPLNVCTSLDEPLDSDDDGSNTKGDFIEDPAATQAFQQTEDAIYTAGLHDALETALARLSDRQAHALRLRYYDGLTAREVGEELHITSGRVHQLENYALRKLRKNETLARWADEILLDYAWKGTGFGVWSSSGSVEERAVERRERLEAERQARLEQEQRERLKREEEQWKAFLESIGYYDQHPDRRPAGSSDAEPALTPA